MNIGTTKKWLLQSLAFSEYCVNQVIGIYLLFILSLALISDITPGCQALCIGLILSIVFEISTLNASYKFHHKIYRWIIGYVYILFVVTNICKIILSSLILERYHESDKSHFFQIAIHIVLGHSSLVIFGGILMLIFKRCCLSKKYVKYYRNCRRMMENIVKYSIDEKDKELYL